MNATVVFAETPNVAAANNAPVPGGLRKLKPVTTEFKQQLELSCEEMTALMAQIIGSGNTNDNSMAIDSAGQKAGIAGILEGFGLLDYQTDTLPAQIQSTPQNQPADMPFVQAQELPEAQVKTTEAIKHTSVSEQFAWMLNQKLDTLPPDVQQHIKGEFQKYLGSLESTNKDQLLSAAPEGMAKPINAQEVQDKLAALLLQLKSVPQQAQTVSDGKISTVMDGGAYAEATQEPKPTAMPEVKTVAVSENKQAAEPVIPAATQPQAAQDSGRVETSAPKIVTDDMPKTDFVKDNVIRIVDKVSASVTEGRHEFDVVLKPDFLGKVSIRLTMENGSIRMHIRTEDMGAKGLFTDHMSGLQSLMKDKGLPVASIDVTYQSEMTAGGGYEAYRQNSGHSGAHNSGAQSGGAYAPEAASGAGLYDAMASPAEHYLGGSSVEYLA